jgi:poly(3-hydroxybutyrate) depolymerase
MFYSAYQAQSDLLQPISALARAALAGYRFWSGLSWTGLAETCVWRNIAASWEMLGRAGLDHERPPFGIESTLLTGRRVAVSEEKILTTPFATLLRFRKAGEIDQPRVLVVAPLSGHFATLLRNTIKTLLPDHDVFITDWHNVRDVPPAAGRFGLDEYVDHLIAFFEALGPGGHVMAVCQPCVQVLSAVALMAENGHPCRPRSMTLMAGPVDTRINPTEVNLTAQRHSLDWFERHLIAPVPAGNKGAGRLVYPGFAQLSAFMAMNMDRHVKAHRDLYRHLARGDRVKAEALESFYDEYFSVLDLPAEFFLETVRDIFQRALLAEGRLTYRGRRIDLSKIRNMGLLTVEGERDDICAVGQTEAAHGLLTGLTPAEKRHHLQPGVGHYGVFSGKRWEREIYPVFHDLVRASAERGIGSRAAKN